MHVFHRIIVIAILWAIAIGGAIKCAHAESRTNHEVNISYHDPLAEFLFGGMHHSHRTLRLQRLHFSTGTFAAKMPSAAYSILPTSRQCPGAAKRHHLLKEVMPFEQRVRSSTARLQTHETRPRSTSPAGAETYQWHAVPDWYLELWRAENKRRCGC